MGRRPGPEVNEERCTSKPMNRLEGETPPFRARRRSVLINIA